MPSLVNRRKPVPSLLMIHKSLLDPPHPKPKRHMPSNSPAKTSFSPEGEGKDSLMFLTPFVLSRLSSCLRSGSLTAGLSCPDTSGSGFRRDDPYQNVLSQSKTNLPKPGMTSSPSRLHEKLPSNTSKILSPNLVSTAVTKPPPRSTPSAAMILPLGDHPGHK